MLLFYLAETLLVSSSALPSIISVTSSYLSQSSSKKPHVTFSSSVILRTISSTLVGSHSTKIDTSSKTQPQPTVRGAYRNDAHVIVNYEITGLHNFFVQ